MGQFWLYELNSATVFTLRLPGEGARTEITTNSRVAHELRFYPHRKEASAGEQQAWLLSV